MGATCSSSTADAPCGSLVCGSLDCGTLDCGTLVCGSLVCGTLSAARSLRLARLLTLAPRSPMTWCLRRVGRLWLLPKPRSNHLRPMRGRTHREWGRRHRCPYGWTSCAVCAHPPVTPHCSTYQMTEGQFSSKRRISAGRTGHIVDPRSSATSLTQV